MWMLVLFCVEGGLFVSNALVSDPTYAFCGGKLMYLQWDILIKSQCPSSVTIWRKKDGVSTIQEVYMAKMESLSASIAECD